MKKLKIYQAKMTNVHLNFEMVTYILSVCYAREFFVNQFTLKQQIYKRIDYKSWVGIHMVDTHTYTLTRITA